MTTHQRNHQSNDSNKLKHRAVSPVSQLFFCQKDKNQDYDDSEQKSHISSQRIPGAQSSRNNPLQSSQSKPCSQSSQVNQNLESSKNKPSILVTFCHKCKNQCQSKVNSLVLTTLCQDCYDNYESRDSIFYRETRERGKQSNRFEHNNHRSISSSMDHDERNNHRSISSSSMNHNEHNNPIRSTSKQDLVLVSPVRDDHLPVTVAVTMTVNVLKNLQCKEKELKDLIALYQLKLEKNQNQLKDVERRYASLQQKFSECNLRVSFQEPIEQAERDVKTLQEEKSQYLKRSSQMASYRGTMVDSKDSAVSRIDTEIAQKMEYISIINTDMYLFRSYQSEYERQQRYHGYEIRDLEREKQRIEKELLVVQELILHELSSV
jgi:hypothetical protein